MRVVSILATSILVVGLAACGGGGGPSDLNLPSTPTTVPPPTTAPAAASGSTASTTPAPPGIGAALPASSLVAHTRVPLLAVYSARGAARATRELANPWPAAANDASVRVNQVFLVEGQPDSSWVNVLLPVLPNGTSGWVHAADVTVTKVPYGIRVSLQARHMTVYSHGHVLWQGAIAVGAPASATPTGQFYVRAILKASTLNAGFGPYAFGLSSNSADITSFSGADGEITIRGSGNGAALANTATLGSIHIPNAELTKLAAVLPLGTPVIISA